ncbi:DUF1707 SHOCT-like domain-containing protein [Thermomonospora amylolytica]|uniref:DUF1707 SHOCT-like domain-containing protein n=1 Tax=Thermomonospora amylolytica TaxID=1411117 RepID=UPI001F342222|nr:DUF1707 domain-containing protein [Thermomonospora amylolytica]
MNVSEPSATADAHPAVPPAGESGGRAAALRASDADRDRVADRLREALAEGRITPDEHAERIDALYRAKTYADLEPLVADLPAPGEPAPEPRVNLTKDAALPAPRRESASIVAVFGGADRRGRWLVEPTTTVLAVFGGVDLDFRTAVLSQRTVTLNVTCLFGGVSVKVPPGVRVENAISAVFGGVSVPEEDVLSPDAPVIRFTGAAIFGGVDIERE